MTGEEYYAGWKYKTKKGSLDRHFLLRSAISAALVVIFAVICKAEFYVYLLAVMLLIMGIVGESSNKKAVIREFEYSPVLSGEHTLRIYDEGIELINSYEKVFAPWQSVFAVEETPEYIKILPAFCKGIAVISKERYAGEELDGIIRAIKANIRIEEGKKDGRI